MSSFGNESSSEGDVYIQRLASYIRKNEEALANGLLFFSKNRNQKKIKPLRLTLTIHHLYYITERIENSALGVDVGPLNIKLDTPNHEPTFISFMANNARNQRQFESDARSITSISSMRSIVSSASVYWRSFSFSKDPKVIQKDVRYLYSSCTKIPCLVLTPKTKVASIAGYEEYPCDTSVPLKMFKNLQVLELAEYEPNEIFGWHTLSEQLRILIIRFSKVTDLSDILISSVTDDENGRSSFSNSRYSKRHDTPFCQDLALDITGSIPKSTRRERALTSGAGSSHQRDLILADPRNNFASSNSSAFAQSHLGSLPESKWFYLRQLSVSEGSITTAPLYVFKPLVNLVKLNLSNNLLEDIPEGLEHLIHVKYVNLADNYITSTRKFPHNLKHLSSLNLSNNKLKSLEGIDKIQVIEKLDIRKNNLDSLEALSPIVIQAMRKESKLNNVMLSGNPLPKNFRVDLFNLFNGSKPKSKIKIDDSRPGYFEGAMLLDNEEAAKKLEKYLSSLRAGSKDQSSKCQQDWGSSNEASERITPESSKGSHRHTKSYGDVAELAKSIAETDLHGLGDNLAKYKHASVMTTASTAPLTPPGSKAENLPMSPSSPTMPLQKNQNLGNQTHYFTAKLPSFNKSSMTPPMIHQSLNGSSHTLKSSSTMTRIDFDSTTIHNTAPNVITPVQVHVEGFQ